MAPVLTESERLDLLTIATPGHAGFAALDKLMKEKIKLMIADYLAVDQGNKDAVLAAHASAQAVINFYSEITESIKFQIEEHIGEVQTALLAEEAKKLEPGKMTPENYLRFL